MTPECSKHIKKLHALLMQVRAEVQAIQPLLEEESDSRSAIAEALNKRLDEDHGCPATTAADQTVSVDADVWACDVEEALDSLGALSTVAGDMGTLLKQAALADWMLANRSSVFELSSDDDSRVCALVDAARNALPDAPKYALDATARAVLALPADVAYPVLGGGK